MRNRVFFPQASLDQWGVEGKIELNPPELVILGEGRRYEIAEGVRIVLEVTGAADPHGILGKVKRKEDLENIGAEILEDSMIIGDNAYDVVPGWLGSPLTSLAAHLEGRSPAAAGGPPASDEEILARLGEGAVG